MLKKHGGGVKSWNFWVEKIFDTTSIEKKLEVSEKLPFLNLTKPEHSCILHGCSGFFIWTFFDTASKKNLEVAHLVWKDFWIWPTLSFFLTPPPSKKHGGGVSNPEISLFIWRRRHHFFGGGGVRRNRLYWPTDAWIHTSGAFHLHHLQVEIVYIDALNKRYGFPQSLANGHITLNTPVLVRSLKLSSVEPSQYLDGWPPGNTGCCWQSFFMIFS